MSDRCKSCGACQHCGQRPTPSFYPYWSVVPPYYVGTTPGYYGNTTTGISPQTTSGTWAGH